MLNNKDIAYTTVAGAIIGISSLISTYSNFENIWDQILIPFIFLGFKQKRNTMSMFGASIIASIILSTYKPYLGILIFGYYIISKVIYLFKGKISLKSILAITFSYLIGFLGVNVFIYYFINEIEFSKIIYILVGKTSLNAAEIAFVIIIEPLIFAFFYLYLMQFIQKRKIFNG